jgi:type IV pilus assembly protein PilY1
VRIIDMSGDGYADRMYASDLGGQLWRFDIYNGKAPADLVTGGRLAALGNGDQLKPVGSTDSRRFFTAPDPSLITYQNESFVNVAIGSGHREKPVLDDATHNRAYGIRDYYPFVQLTQQQYDDRESDGLVVRDTADDLSCDPANPPDPAKPLGVLMDVTTCNRAPIPPGSPGWKLDMTASGAWSGEKVLSESVTFQNIVYMPSYEPGAGSDVCAPAVGVNRLYEVSAATGATKLYWDNPALPDAGVREPPTELRQGGISPSVVFVFPEGEAGKRNPDPECLAGLAECGEGAKSRPVRTYWRQRGTQ